MDNTHTIGIWGLGRVGKSIVNLLFSQNYTISIMTRDTLSEDDKSFLHERTIKLFTENEKDTFFAINDYILSSPGIDIKPYYLTYKDKWITELDLFYNYFKKPIIAITGTVGKTTVTSLLDQILKQYTIPLCTGGNIGIPMCDLIAQQNMIHYGLIEVSSFQLEYCTQFAPELAIWTNFASNHLDRHTLDEYFNAKYKILAHQTTLQKTLVPLCLAQVIKNKKPVQKNIHYFSLTIPTQAELNLLNQNDILFFIDNNYLKKRKNNQICSLLDLQLLPNITFTENWLIICSALDILGLDIRQLPMHTAVLTIPEHRMEQILLPSKNIVFYNDSKSTTITSLAAAIEKLQNKPIILFIGGLSKGVNRAQCIATLKDKVKYIYCFGAESNELYHYCAMNTIPGQAFATLDDAFNACKQNLEINDCVLFSPAGSSYDLFKDYEERGNYFKKLVHNFINVHTTT